MARVGLGYDSHRLVAGRFLVLGGVKIEHESGLSGHSDADAVLHAIADAVLGALAAGDIGEHFPPEDDRWRNADSAEILGRVVSMAQAQGCEVVNCDVTVIAESPKLTPYKAAMRDRIADILHVQPQAVSVKAKTNEGMGWIGRGEGIAALAVVLLE